MAKKNIFFKNLRVAKTFQALNKAGVSANELRKHFKDMPDIMRISEWCDHAAKLIPPDV